jgi:uncharacterized protein YhbP (UPF0306 family)
MKLANYPKLAKFLNDEIIAVISMPVDEQGTLHIATLHYSHNPEPLQFYFVTGRDTEKCTLLKQKASVQAACVVGTTRGVPFTVQMRGELRIVEPKDRKEAVAAYQQKRHSRNDDLADGKNVLLEFTPSWARFTDFAEGWEAHHFLDLA